MFFFFLEDGRLKGRLKGTYQISNDELYIKADIDSFAIVYGWELQLLNGFPQRYEDLASLLKEGIRGPMTFLENGFDSQFYVEFGQGDKIWFERY